ncbi:hypothetical protein GCM10011584_28380 [Nocardioides phosphati]|uniref:Metallophosphoesterase n=1 Tax=Nocardioides phosphati TaxID=1867775 RepID=A0ABQ2NC48_9ACTN|nr:metallophosphoesterase [Nocardioides phosphati]GGO92300.1 hypothetical protein GCM10011584_28380 [Nocardioides phosphati]
MIRRLLGYVLAWLLLAAALSFAVLITSSTTITLASHDTKVAPQLSRWTTIRTGPLLPDLRLPSHSWIGVELTLGNTRASSTDQLVERWAQIAVRPESQVDRVRSAVRHLAVDAALRGGSAALIPLAAFELVAVRRRREPVEPHAGRQWVAVGLVGALATGLLAWQPWRSPDPLWVADEWEPLADVAPELTLPKELHDVQVAKGSTTDATRRLLASAVQSYRQGKEFYARAAAKARGLDLRQPEKGETVALLVADRHDNIGMDEVVRAIGDTGGATAILDAGDDTSSGEAWEAFSLDSLDDAFHDLDRWVAPGNHDQGTFVRDYLHDHGWVVPTGKVVEGPGGSTLLSADDPRASGLGIWRDDTTMSVPELGQAIADVACKGKRVGTLLVHDSDAGTESLRRGCVDLVLSGHVHVEVGPDRVEGANGDTGWTYTVGTTGGAAYAFALGSKLRRAAMVTLVTYADGRPVGLQGVTLQTNGVFSVGAYKPLALTRAADPRR